MITYSLQASLSVVAQITGARITDGIPGGTSYVAGSLTLDGSLLSDAADSDAGAFDPDAASITVALPDPPTDPPPDPAPSSSTPSAFRFASIERKPP
ncbi:MAG: hypothetical protein WDN06_05980 [Asticcacaulis sp.]